MKKGNVRFIIGVILLFTNQPLGWGGMILFNSLALKYHKPFYSYIGFSIYALSWGILFLGVYLAGKEGVIFVKNHWKRIFSTLSKPFKKLFSKKTI